MKWLLFIFLVPISLLAQQRVKLCDYEKTEFTYTTQSNIPGVLRWTINGIVFPGETLMIDWKDYSYGKYTITVVFQTDGCETKESFTVNLEECPDLIVWVPNSFTPNGDGVNDIFIPVSYKLNPDEYIFEIYNRWGEKIFYTENHMKGWDGTYSKRECPDDIYAYRLYIKKGSEIYSTVGKVMLLK